MNQTNNNSKATDKDLAHTIISVKSVAAEEKEQSVSLTIQLNTLPKPSRRRWRTYEFPLL